MQWLCLEKDARRPFPASPSTARDPPQTGRRASCSLLRHSMPRLPPQRALGFWAVGEVARGEGCGKQRRGASETHGRRSVVTD